MDASRHSMHVMTLLILTITKRKVDSRTVRPLLDYFAYSAWVMKSMASVALGVGASSLHGVRDLSGGHLSRQVPSLFTRRFSGGRYLACTAASKYLAGSALATSMTLSPADLHIQQAWEFWKKLGSPKYHVAPMVDQVPSSTCCICNYVNRKL